MSHPPIDQQITFLYTLNLEETAAFYEEMIGLELALDQGSCHIYRTGPAAFLGFCERAETPAEPVGIIFTLVTDDVDGWYDYLADKGVTFEKEPQTNPAYQIYHCLLRDPNGYLIEIQRFLETDLS